MLNVLFEEKSGEYYVGHAQNMLEVKVVSREDLTGRVICCIPERYLGDSVLCRIVNANGSDTKENEK